MTMSPHCSCNDLTVDEQKLAVKRFKDRWMKKLDRWAKERGGRRPV